MRPIDSTRPALSLVTSTTGVSTRTRSEAGALRTCRCGWEAFRSSAAPAELDWATHQVETHATEAERHRIGEAVLALEDEFAAIGEDLPSHLLSLVVHRVLGGASAGVSGVAA